MIKPFISIYGCLIYTSFPPFLITNIKYIDESICEVNIENNRIGLSAQN